MLVWQDDNWRAVVRQNRRKKERQPKKLAKSHIVAALVSWNMYISILLLLVICKAELVWLHDVPGCCACSSVFTSGLQTSHRGKEAQTQEPKFQLGAFCTSPEFYFSWCYWSNSFHNIWLKRIWVNWRWTGLRSDQVRAAYLSLDDLHSAPDQCVQACGQKTKKRITR